MPNIIENEQPSIIIVIPTLSLVHDSQAVGCLSIIIDAEEMAMIGSTE